MKSETIPFFPFSKIMFFWMLLVLPSTLSLFGQGTISPQRLGYPRICANIPSIDYPNGYNRYEVPFKISGFAVNETFIVLLSSDNFATVIKPKIIPNGPGIPADTPTDRTLTFEVPADLVGSDFFKLRVQSSSVPTITSTDFKSSDLQSSFPIHFLSYSGPFYINNKNNTVSFCTGGSVTLSIDNSTPTVPNSSPLLYPQLKYKWYKDGSVIGNESKSTLLVNQVGDYYVEIDYGPCSDLNTHSQIVKVTSASGSSASITSSSGNPFCPSQMTTLTAGSANSYAWRKDGNSTVIGTSQTYQTNLPGIYTCEVDFGGCKATGSIDLKSTGAIYSNGNVVAEGETLSFDQGETLKVTTTTTISNPTYKWYRNDNEITSATQSSLDVTLAGNYKVLISGCALSFIAKYDTVINYNVPKVPNVISPNSDGTNDTWIIPDAYSNTNTHVTILSSLGEIVFETDNYDNSNGWPQSNIDIKSFNPVYYYIITPNGQSAKKGSITVLK